MKMNKVLFATLLASAMLVSAVTGCSTAAPMPAQKAGAFVDDSYLTTAVKSKLLLNVSLKAFEIKVITDHQVVTLSGTVPTEALRETAISVAKSVDGVKDVISNIEVKSGS